MYRDSNPGPPTQSASRSIAGAKKENRAKRATVTQASQVVPHPSTSTAHEVHLGGGDAGRRGAAGRAGGGQGAGRGAQHAPLRASSTARASSQCTRRCTRAPAPPTTRPSSSTRCWRRRGGRAQGARRGERRIKKKRPFNTRLDLLLFGPVQGRSGCGVAALWCTTHAGFAPCSPTFRVPLGTSHANSADVFTDLFGRKLRHGRSRKRRSERGRHHAKGTRYVGELQIWPSGWTHELPFSPQSPKVVANYQFPHCADRPAWS